MHRRSFLCIAETHLNGPMEEKTLAVLQQAGHEISGAVWREAT
jgi:hypothetical protein